MNLMLKWNPTDFVESNNRVNIMTIIVVYFTKIVLKVNALVSKLYVNLSWSTYIIFHSLT